MLGLAELAVTQPTVSLFQNPQSNQRKKREEIKLAGSWGGGKKEERQHERVRARSKAGSGCTNKDFNVGTCGND